MAHTWKLPYGGGSVSDSTHSLYYRGQKIKEAWYRGEKVWGDEGASFGEVIFWDWTGRKLYTMSATDLLKASAFPNGIHPDSTWGQDKYPDVMEWWLHWGLEDDGWTYTLEQAKEYLSKVGYLDIAAVYSTPNNGADTIFWVNASVGKRTQLHGYSAITGGVDWGDGTVTNGSVTNPSHTYSDASAYRIVISSNELWLGKVSARAGATYQLRAQLQYFGGPFGYGMASSDNDYLFVSSNTTPSQAEVSAHDTPRTTDIKPIAIYTGNTAYYTMASFFGSDIRYVGMVRGHDPFTGIPSSGYYQNMTFHDGCFQNCNYLETVTLSPGCNSLPFFMGDGGVYADGYEVMYDKFSTIYTVANEYYYNVPFAISTAINAPRLSHIFMSPGFTGKTTARPVGYGYNLRYYGFNAIQTANEDAQPFGIAYPLSTVNLVCTRQRNYIDRIIIPTDEISTQYSRMTFGQVISNVNAKIYVPTGRAEYYASVLPNGSQLLAEGRIIEASPPA